VDLELQCTVMVEVGAAVYRDGWSWSCSVQRGLELSYSVQRWLELELQCTEMVGVGAVVYRDGRSWSYSVQIWLELEL
jgi:hypothetical protein